MGGRSVGAGDRGGPDGSREGNAVTRSASATIPPLLRTRASSLDTYSSHSVVGPMVRAAASRTERREKRMVGGMYSVATGAAGAWVNSHSTPAESALRSTRPVTCQAGEYPPIAARTETRGAEWAVRRKWKSHSRATANPAGINARNSAETRSSCVERSARGATWIVLGIHE